MNPYYENIQYNKPFGNFDSILHIFTSSANVKTPLYNVQKTKKILQVTREANNSMKGRKNELNGLIERETWKVVRKDDINDESNIIGRRFLLDINNEGTKKRFGNLSSLYKVSAIEIKLY